MDNEPLGIKMVLQYFTEKYLDKALPREHQPVDSGNNDPLGENLMAETFGEITALYQIHELDEEGREWAGEIEAFELNGEPVTEEQLIAYGFIVPTREQIQERLDAYASDDYDR